MLPSFLLSLREGLEAALIIGILFGALQKIGRNDLRASILLGVSIAAAVSILTAVVLTTLGLKLEDPGEAIFEGITMFLAAGILTYMIFWMSKQSRTLKAEIEAGVSKAAALDTAKSALFWLAFIAVVREGIELALFLTAAVFASNALQTVIGSLLGLFTAVLLSWTLFASTVRLDLKRFFQVTGVLLILFAAGLVAHGVHEFNEVGWIPSIIEHLWDLNNVVSDTSFLGEILKTLFGYNPSPSLTEMLAYVLYFVVVYFTLRTSEMKEDQAAQKA